MAYNTVPIKKDSEGKPIPQYYDKVKNEYEVLEGHNGASKTILYDKDGNEVELKKILDYISVETTGINDHVSDISSQLISMEDILENIYGKDTTQTYYGLSTETKPTNNMTKGNTYFEIDTSEVYMWNGTSWVVI